MVALVERSLVQPALALMRVGNERSLSILPIVRACLSTDRNAPIPASLAAPRTSPYTPQPIKDLDESEETFAFATVTGIIEREKSVLIQIRKDEDPRYDNTLEIPTGKIRAGESPHEALRREVLEETGLEITAVIDSAAKYVSHGLQDPAATFTPFTCVCQQIGTKSWAGFAFRCQVETKTPPLPQMTEVRKIEWMTTEDLKRILEEEPQRVNTFSLCILKAYIKWRVQTV